MLVRKKVAALEELRAALKEKTERIKKLEKELHAVEQYRLSVDSLLHSERKIHGLFKYYTGITYIRFMSLLAFLNPSSVTYEKGRRDITKLQPQDCLLLALCRMRHNFGIVDVAVRFGVAVRSATVIFKTWVQHIYIMIGQVGIWPHRDIIISNMPAQFRIDFPTSLIIIDGTELRTQSPCSLPLQSQMYSDYKSSTTLKCLIGCDPKGSLMFVSALFTGSISDNEIVKQSGFLDLLKTLLHEGYIHENDAIMADKGFTIEKDLAALGLKLNTPPFVSSTLQMTPGECELTRKIAKHRVHIERLIAKVKKYKMVSQRIPTFLFNRINEIWTICCHLTLFDDIFVTDKTT